MEVMLDGWCSQVEFHSQQGYRTTRVYTWCSGAHSLETMDFSASSFETCASIGPRGNQETIVLSPFVLESIFTSDTENESPSVEFRAKDFHTSNVTKKVNSTLFNYWEMEVYMSFID